MKDTLNEMIEFCDDVISCTQPPSKWRCKAEHIKTKCVDLLLEFNYISEKLKRKGLKSLEDELNKEIEDLPDYGDRTEA